jgi:predicted CopG family antitoxin
MHYITSIEVMQMNSELDRIKSTITISLGTKNRLRKLKEGQSYEDYINYLIRMRNQIAHSDNVIELQKFKRKQGMYSEDNFKILFSYNEYNNSENFIFDIKIENVRKDGKKISFGGYITGTSNLTDRKSHDSLKVEYAAYFRLLQIAIQIEIEPLFRHNGRFEDYYSWKSEFRMLNLSKKSFVEDVMAKLEDYRYEQGVF